MVAEICEYIMGLKHMGVKFYVGSSYSSNYIMKM